MAKVLGGGAALAVLTFSIFGALPVQTASAFPTFAQDCVTCHGAGTLKGTVTAIPSITTPAAGAAYNVPLTISLNPNGGDTGYWVANSTAAGTTGTSVLSGGADGTNSLMYPISMTAPAAAGTYWYKVWGVQGSPNLNGQANFALYSITVGSAPAGPNITAVAPTHGLAGSEVTITGTDLGGGGAVTIGGLTATTGAWSATSITATVPALAPGAADVIVTPTGGSASNTATYTVDAPSTTPGTANITSLSPTQGRAGTKVTITGTDFGCRSSLRWMPDWTWSRVSTANSNAVLDNGVACLPSVLQATQFARDDDSDESEEHASHDDHATHSRPAGTVRFGTVKAKVISWTATTIVVKVPRGNRGKVVPVTVTPKRGATSNSVDFQMVRGDHDDHGDHGHGDDDDQHDE